MKTNRRIIFLFLSVVLVSCNTKEDPLSGFKKLNKQYLLTNEVSFLKRETTYGGSSYLVKIDGKIYLSTARHLTGPSGGYDPKIDLETYMDSIVYWKAYPRNGSAKFNTVITDSLLYSDDDLYDIILLSVKRVPSQIGVLKPRYSKLKIGDKVRILGCEYENSDCLQKDYFATVTAYTELEQLEIVMDSTYVEIAGFSGAPVLDKNNYVVGHVLGGADFGDGVLKLYAAPIYLAKKVLR